MEIFGFQTVENKPGLYHPNLDMIVISDLHLGLERSMTSKGSYVPQFQLEDAEKDIEEMQEETDASRILINGDLKNEFLPSHSEKDEIKAFLKFLDGLFDDIIIVEGNHDTLIEETVKEEGLRMLDEYLEDGILFTHGHEDTERKDFNTIVIGHEHPALVLTDKIGVSEKIDCFLYGQTKDSKNILVLPAFSRIASGTGVNEVPRRELLSPILKNYTDKNSLKAVGVDREGGVFEFPSIGQI